MKLLHCSVISSTPSGASGCCSCSLSLLNGSCSAYGTHLGGIWYGFAASLTLGEKVSPKYQKPVNMLLNSVFIFTFVLTLVAFSVFGVLDP